MLTCAQCQYFMHQPGNPDLASRVCFGGPPQVINMPVRTPQGQGITQVMVRPAPAATEPACAQFKFKLTVANDPSPSNPAKAQ